MQNTKIQFASTETKLYEKIVLATYVCDFENVVINMQKKKVFKILNSGMQSIDYSFDNKNFRNAGYVITPERVQK